MYYNLYSINVISLHLFYIILYYIFIKKAMINIKYNVIIVISVKNYFIFYFCIP